MNKNNAMDLSYEEAKAMAIEEITIKEHDCLFVNFENDLGYSVLVFKNGRHISVADDFACNHIYIMESKGIQVLKQCYISELNLKLFTDDDLMGPVSSIADFRNKTNFLKNIWVQRYDHNTVFVYPGDAFDEESLRKEKEEYPYFNSICSCYVKDESIVQLAEKIMHHLKKAYNDHLYGEN